MRPPLLLARNSSAVGVVLTSVECAFDMIESDLHAKGGLSEGAVASATGYADFRRQILQGGDSETRR